MLRSAQDHLSVKSLRPDLPAAQVAISQCCSWKTLSMHHLMLDTCGHKPRVCRIHNSKLSCLISFEVMWLSVVVSGCHRFNTWVYDTARATSLMLNTIVWFARIGQYSAHLRGYSHGQGPRVKLMLRSEEGTSDVITPDTGTIGCTTPQMIDCCVQNVPGLGQSVVAVTIGADLRSPASGGAAAENNRIKLRIPQPQRSQ